MFYNNFDPTSFEQFNLVLKERREELIKMKLAEIEARRRKEEREIKKHFKKAGKDNSKSL